MNQQTKLSTLQLVLLSTGGMIGAGWLFAPYYGFETAGIGVLLSWLLIAIIIFIISLSFAEVSSILPIVGGVSRFIGITHNSTLGFIFLSLSWLSYVVYLPLEAQSAIQYLGFWWHDLVTQGPDGIELSLLGLGVAFVIILGLTWFNTLFISQVAKANSLVSIWKLLIPLGIALFLILIFGKWENVTKSFYQSPISFEKILLAITSSGLAFAFTGFQNGLVLSNNALNKKKSLPYSLFVPIIFGTIIYISLSLAFIACLPEKTSVSTTAVAPLLGLVALFSLHVLYIILFIDAIIAPLGTANVFTAITGRILFSLAKDFLPNSIFTKLNSYSSPYIALWTSAIIGICFLLPFPTWRELVNLLSSIVVFAYLSGPIALIILRRNLPHKPRNFKVKYHRLIGYLGFICVSLLIYWSGTINLAFLLILLIAISLISSAINKLSSIILTIKNSFVLISYILSLMIISYLHNSKVIAFPLDNVYIILISIIFCYLLLRQSLDEEEIINNMQKLDAEIEANNAN